MSQLNVFQWSLLQRHFKVDLATISNRNSRISLKILTRVLVIALLWLKKIKVYQQMGDFASHLFNFFF